MEKPFDELTRGQQFLRLLRMEYQDLIHAAKFRNHALEYSLVNYVYESDEIEQVNREIKANLKDIEYFQEALGKLGGVENGDTILTESIDSESPTDRFDGVKCTTIM